MPPEPEPRSGWVELAPGEPMTAPAFERTLRADAARYWQRDDGGAGLSVQVEPVTWRNGALGCPLPDRLYTTAHVPGWRAVVSDGSHRATYHASANGRWLLCPADRTEAPDATR